MAMINERKLLLLGLLRGSDMHGYLLNAHLDGSVPISLKKPTAYNLLERMEKEGWVEHRDEPTGDRPRRVYSLTPEGEVAFLGLLREQLASFSPAELPSAVSLSFLDAIPPADAVKLLRRRRESVTRFRESLLPGDGRGADGHHHGNGHLAIEYARRFAELEMQILDEVTDHLEVT